MELGVGGVLVLLHFCKMEAVVTHYMAKILCQAEIQRTGGELHRIVGDTVRVKKWLVKKTAICIDSIPFHC